MQNTARVQSHSNTVIKNFLISGLSQETLKDRIQKSLGEQTNITPEIIFSLYEPEEESQKILQLIFPQKVDILESPSEEMVKPKFFTFMTTDPLGVNTFTHCIIYYELFTKYDVLHDDEDPLLSTLPQQGRHSVSGLREEAEQTAAERGRKPSLLLSTDSIRVGELSKHMKKGRRKRQEST